MNDLEFLLKEWHGQLESSRQAVFDELRDIAAGWVETANDYDTEQDAKTLGLVIRILENIERIER